MLFGDFVRSPHAHARITRIDVSKALALPGVKAVLTAAELKPLNLHYMPTLAGDVQAVLADEKVLFQNQEVAFVIADDRYIAADAVELVEVEYEPLPALVDPFQAMQPDAPVLREDIKDKTDGRPRRASAPQPHLHLGGGRQGGRGRGVRAGRGHGQGAGLLPAGPSLPARDLRLRRRLDKVKGELTIYGTFQAPHVVRTVASLLSGIPEAKVRVIAPDIGGGFGNKVGVYSGYICSAWASIVLGVPVKWVEDRMDYLFDHAAFARDYHMTSRARGRRGRPELGAARPMSSRTTAPSTPAPT